MNEDGELTTSGSKDVFNTRKKRFNSDYQVDMWREVKKRWMVVGVLVAIMLAVVSPRVGAPGGPLHTEYLSYLPLSYIYYSAGRRSRPLASLARSRLLAVSCSHATLAAPALCVALLTAHRDIVHNTLIEGLRVSETAIPLYSAMLSSVGGGCAWLSLSLCSSAAAATLTALNYVVTLFATPLAMILFCGRATVPPLGGILSTLLTTLTPYTLGAFRPRHGHDSKTTKLSALLLLYADCCGRLRDAEGSLYVGDVLVTLTLELCWLVLSAGTCWAYGRSGLLSAHDAHTVAMCAVPRALHRGWESSTSCNPSGLSLLPAVFLSPAQALLLAAIAHDDDDFQYSTDDKEDDLTIPQ